MRILIYMASEDLIGRGRSLKGSQHSEKAIVMGGRKLRKKGKYFRGIIFFYSVFILRGIMIDYSVLVSGVLGFHTVFFASFVFPEFTQSRLIFNLFNSINSCACL